MKIIVDAFGGDNAPLEILKGCEIARNEYNLDILLVGNIEILKKVAKENNINLSNFEVCNAEDVITADDEPTDITRSKKNSSMAVGLKLLAEERGDAFVSAGASGALTVGATLIVKRIRGIKRAAFAPVIPKNKGYFMLIDSGANAECRPEMLLQFGMMGSAYMKSVMNIEKPRIGLASNGTEEHKGDTLRQETFNLLKNSNLNFVGNVEARDIPDDGADVIVTDGFTGNIILKLFEGVSNVIFNKFKNILNKDIKNKIAAAIILKDLKEMKAANDYKEHGGAAVLGTKKPVFKAHGSADAKTFKNAIRLAVKFAEGNVIEKIENEIANGIT